MTAEFDIIEMRRLADPKDANQLMLAAIEAALAGVGLDPHHQVDMRAVGLPAGVDQLALVPPVHADIMECARAGMRRRVAEGLAQEFDVFLGDISPDAMANSRCLVRPRPTTLLIFTL